MSSNLIKNKLFVYLIFIFSAFAMLGFVFSSLDKVKSDVYTLISMESNSSLILESMQKKNSHNIMFLSSNLELLKELSSSELFSEFELTYDLDSPFLSALELCSISTIDRKTYNQILDNPNEFFAYNAANLFSPFSFRIISSDFLNFASYSTLLAPSNLTLDIKTQSLKTIYEDQIYYFAYGVLKENFSSSKLLEFYKLAKKKAKINGDKLLIVGSEIFAGFAKEDGNKESIIMGSLSLILITILLIFAFSSFKIFKLVVVIVFSFLCGLSGAFLIFDYISLFSIVISVSLIGLILDFSMHFLGYKQGQSIQKNNIKQFLRIFLIGLFVTTLGYSLFILAPIGFLKEIAIISIFSLIGAFLATYFLLPYILDGDKFKSHRVFELALKKFIWFNFYILGFKRVFIAFMFFVAFILVIYLGYSLPGINFKDDIRNYSSLNQELIDENQEFLQISKNPFYNSFIALSFKPNEDKIAKELALLKDLNITNYQSSSNILLSQEEQEKLKHAFEKYAKDSEILKHYTTLGIEANLVQSYLENMAKFDILSFDEFASMFAKNSPLDAFIYDDMNLIFIDPINNAEADFEQILNRYDASYFNLSQSISSNFTYAKEYAIYLKLVAYLFAFGIFLLFFGFVRASLMVGIILFATLISVALLLVFGVSFNIFTIFGFILASTIGVDYVLFAANSNLDLKERYFGIILASLTSVISFGMLCFSDTYAVFSFGISTALCMLLLAYFALLYATFVARYSDENLAS